MASLPTRRAYLGGLAAGLGALAGCSGAPVNVSAGDGEDGGEDGDGASASGVEPPADAPTGSPPLASSSLVMPRDPVAVRNEVRDVVSKDGIPAVDEPGFVPASRADFMDDGDPVFGVTLNGQSKAYPQKVLVWHEIANDVVGGVPVSVTYCPLTGTAMGYYRGDTTFGVSGDLVNNNLVMYDRATDSRWPQILGTCTSGEHLGQSLRQFPVVWTTFGRWREAHPGAPVLSTDTGYARNYDRDPYGAYNPRRGYYVNENTLFPRLTQDGRLHPKEVVLGVRTPAGAATWKKDVVRERRVVPGDLAGTPHVAVHDRALDAGYVYANPDGVTVTPEGNRIRVDGGTYAPDDLPLERVMATDAMWFAWSGFYPDVPLHA